MCGIYGRIGPRDDALDRTATLTLRHRGPDHAGLYVDTRDIAGAPGVFAALGHTRLSVLDLSPAGHQPMRSDDEQTVIVYNGEIYNFQRLRYGLRAAGVRFRSESDTEVLLRLYERDGDAFLAQLTGMFALAVWDRRRGRLLLARDVSGIKPLYVRRADAATGVDQGGLGPLAFASEPKALLRDPTFRREADRDALAGYLTYLHIPPPRSAFLGITPLRPGHKLTWQARATGGDAEMRVERFHHFATTPKLRETRLSAAVDGLDALLRAVVADHLVADVPVGAFLSGGIDSGVLVALAAEHRRARGDSSQLATFTLGFGPEGAALDEGEAAASVARALGVRNRLIRVNGDLAAACLPRIVGQFDEPFANPTALLQDLLCEAARAEVAVVLAGDGGDEAFAGYPRHRAIQTYRLLRRLPVAVRGDLLGRLARQLPDRADAAPLMRRMRRLLTQLDGDFATVYRGWLTHYPPAELVDLLADPALLGADGGDPGPVEALIRDARAGVPDDAEPHAKSHQRRHAEPSLLDLACLADVQSCLPDNVLRPGDRMSMGHGLELRVPYADRRVLDFGLSLPDALRMSPVAAILGAEGHDASKRVLRHLAKRYLPARVAAAPKQGMVPPLGTWLNAALRPLVDAATSPATLARRGLVRPDRVTRMREEHRRGERDRTWNLWALVVLEDWYARRIDRLDLPEIAENLACERYVAT